jgi:SPX domain protein involved in polyphosphate accumulation
MAENKDMKFRHELKYPVSAGDIILLENRAKALMPLDPHAENGSYSIRSLYFDDYRNTCYYENENGTDPREKFRIRIYNASSERITLECKRKERGKTHKSSCPLTLAEAESLVRGIPIGNIEEQHPLLRKLTLLMLTRATRPVVIVEYDRIPYVYRDGNVRVTFDTNVSASADVGRFFDEYIPKRPVMEAGMSLMEVKYDEYMPDFIYESLGLGKLRQSAFSKFYLGRRFTKFF